MDKFSDKSIEDLEAMLRNPELIAPETAEPEPEPPPEPAPEPTPEPEPEPAAPEPEKAPESEPTVDELAILRATLDEMTARHKKMESQLGRFAGEADFWRKKAETGTTRPEPMPDSDPTDVEPEPSRPRPTPERDEITAWAVARAAQEAAASFAASNPEVKDLEGDIQNYLKTSGFDPQKILLARGPIEAARETTRVLDEAFWHVKAAKAESRRAELEKLRSEQFARQAEAKKRASISASGSVSPPAAKPKTLNDMTTEELEAELRRLSVR